MAIRGIISKVKKIWDKPTIERISIFAEPRGYCGMSKQMAAMHAEHDKQERCMKKCMSNRR